MKINTPQMAWNNCKPILSVDIQNRLFAEQDSHQLYRLATGGHDSRVNIWRISLNTTTNHKKPVDSIDCVAELTQHRLPVNIVRFSPNLNDNLLATGDDDSLIYIWKLCDSENVCDDNSENRLEGATISIESWKPYKILRGHSQDICDLSWSKDGQCLVSGSIDNSIHIWDVHRGKARQVIKEHRSYVQGVTWDPLNKYIGSLSADRNMVIFNSNNGKAVHRVYKLNTTENPAVEGEKKFSSKLFFDQTLTSFSRRLTFSPGGELLFAPTGIYETGSDDYKNTVYVFERNSMNRPSFYLPTNHFSIVVSCCPIVFELKTGIENNFKFPYRIVFAVATQHAVLLYDSQQLFPFAYIAQIHYLPLTDLSWSPDGRILVATSEDNYLTFITFEEDEFGIPYKGKLLELEELEPTPIASEAKSAKKHNATKVIEQKEKLNSTPITPNNKNIKAFFKPLSSFSNNPKRKSSTPTSSIKNKTDNKEKHGRRVSLITLFAPNQDNEKNDCKLLTEPESTANLMETGLKRKLPDSDNSTANTSNCI